MKNGVYYLDHWDEIFLVKGGVLTDYRGVEYANPPYNYNLEYIGEFWDESAELERYKKALELAIRQRNSYLFDEGRATLISVINQNLIRRHDEEINKILKGCEG